MNCVDNEVWEVGSPSRQFHGKRLNRKVSLTQLRLFPNAQPLVERLGRDFFRSLPSHSGVYRLRDASNAVIYVGKAKNLRQRLSQYRVANPEQLPRRTIRLLHTAVTIDWEECPDELAALARERELLLALRPRFNRAGVWPGRPWFLVWRFADGFLELALEREPPAGWEKSGPWGGVAAEVIARVTSEGFGLLDVAPQRLNAKDTPVPYHPDLWSVHRPTASAIAEASRRLLNI